MWVQIMLKCTHKIQLEELGMIDRRLWINEDYYPLGVKDYTVFDNVAKGCAMVATPSKWKENHVYIDIFDDNDFVVFNVSGLEGESFEDRVSIEEISSSYEPFYKALYDMIYLCNETYGVTPEKVRLVFNCGSLVKVSLDCGYLKDKKGL